MQSKVVKISPSSSSESEVAKVFTDAQQAQNENLNSTDSTISTEIKKLNLETDQQNRYQQVPAEIETVASDLLKRFVPLRPIHDYLVFRLQEHLNLDQTELRRLAKEVTKKILNNLKEGDGVEKDWNMKLNLIFKGTYPRVPREFLRGDKIVSKCHMGERVFESEQPITFTSDFLKPIGSVNDMILMHLAPSLHDVNCEDDLPKIEKTVEAARFKNLEEKALSKGALVELITFNRPLAYEQNKVSLSSQGLVQIFRFARPTVKPQMLDATKKFLDLLETTFEWASEGDFAKAVAYLIQPFIKHLAPGEFPAYAFVGPSGSGKTTLGRTIPKNLFHNGSSQIVLETKMPKEVKENQLLMSRAAAYVYTLFDEAVDMSLEQTKYCDQLVTSTEISTREMYKGYESQPNLVTIGLTTVDITLSDETARRFAIVRLKEKLRGEITNFFQQSLLLWPEVLAGFLYHVERVDKAHLKSLHPRQGRGRGFSMLEEILVCELGLKPDFSTEAERFCILGAIVQMFEEKVIQGQESGKWWRFSYKTILEGLSKQHSKLLKSRQIEALLVAALPKRSTENDPSYEQGYIGKSGAAYHMALKSEGKKASRTWICLRKLEKPLVTIGSIESTDPRLAEEVQYAAH